MKANGEDANKALAQNKQETVYDFIKRLMPAIERAMPNIGITKERMTSIFISAVNSNPKLGTCDRMSLLACIMQSVQLGLEVNNVLGQAYLVPFKNNKRNCMEVKFILGYQGLMTLCYRTGLYNLIDAHSVYEKDEFNYKFGLNPDLTHIPRPELRKENENPILYYALYKAKNGFSHFFVMTHDEVMEHARKYTQSWDKDKECFVYGSAWKDNFPRQAMKTCIKGLLKYAPKSVNQKETHLEKAVGIDESVSTAHVENIGGEETIIINNDFQTPEQEETPENQIEDKTEYKQEDAKENPKQPSPFEQKAIERSKEELRQLLDSDFISDNEKQNGLAWLKTKEASIQEKLDEKIKQIEKYINAREYAEKKTEKTETIDKALLY